MNYSQHSLALDKQRDRLNFEGAGLVFDPVGGDHSHSTIAILMGAARRFAREQKASAAITFAAKALRDPKAVADWIGFLTTHHAQYGALPPRPRCLRKPLRNYGYVGRNVAQRANSLVAHYTFVASKLLPSSHRDLLNLGKIRLGRLQAKGACFDLWLASSLTCGQKQEGELSLRLADMAGRSLARLAFSCDRDLNGAPTLVIGGLQGLQSNEDKKIIVAATRALSGLRPKDAVLVAAHALARSVGIERVLAVSNSTHVLASEWFSRSVISRDYDTFWGERGGIAEPTVGYQLPAIDYEQRVASSPAPRMVDKYRADLALQVNESIAAIKR